MLIECEEDRTLRAVLVDVLHAYSESARRSSLPAMSRREREILEHAVHTIPEQAMKVDELVDERRLLVEAIIRSRSTRRCCDSSS